MKLWIESTTLVFEGPQTESFKVMGILFSISECAYEQNKKYYLQNYDNIVLTTIRHMQTKQVRPHWILRSHYLFNSSYSVLQTAGRIFNFRQL
jgi:hypothetical protein